MSPPAHFLFGTNFKMHQTPAESHRFVRELTAALPPGLPAQLFVIPPFTSLAGLPELAAPHGIWVGAQNMHGEPEGAYTGEVSPRMLQALGVDLVLLGHAERRQRFHETDGELRKKVKAALSHGLRVLLCVGEDAAERECGAAPATVVRQVRMALHGAAPGAGRLLLAYEPVWSIGSGGRAATPADVAPVVRALRQALQELDHAHVPILYGGSVNPENCGAYAAMPELDGLFVGRSAWSVPGFVQVLTAALAARRAPDLALGGEQPWPKW